MTHEELLDAILVEWAKNKPITKPVAMDIVRTILTDYPREMSTFGEWFEKNGDIIVSRFNSG